jgi:hypothetical protein
VRPFTVASGARARRNTAGAAALPITIIAIVPAQVSRLRSEGHFLAQVGHLRSGRLRQKRELQLIEAFRYYVRRNRRP